MLRPARNQFTSRGNRKGLVDGFRMVMNRVGTDPQLPSDLLLDQSFHQKAENTVLSRGQYFKCSLTHFTISRASRIIRSGWLRFGARQVEVDHEPVGVNLKHGSV